MKCPSVKDCILADTAILRAYLKKRSTHKGPRYWYFKSNASHPVVTVVCHIDTVYDTRKGEVWDYKTKSWNKPDRSRMRVLFDKPHKIFWSPDGLGADDRAGVYGAFHLMSKINPENAPNFLFCDEEEVGCNGARDASAEIKDLLKQSLFMIELDRRNHSDCVFYNDEPDDFVKHIEKYGFKKEFGSVSDITYLGQSAEISAVNLSVGYYEEHTKSEFLEVRSLDETLDRAINIILDAHKDQTLFPNPYRRKSYPSYYERGLFVDDGYGYGVAYNRDYKSGYAGFGGRGVYGDHFRCLKGHAVEKGPYPETVSKNLGAVVKSTKTKDKSNGDADPNHYIRELQEWMTACGY